MGTIITEEILIEASDKLCTLWEAGKIKCPIHLPGGNEKELIVIFDDIGPKDYVFSHHRNAYHYLLKGGSLKTYIQEAVVSLDSPSKGRSGCMSIIDPDIKFYASPILSGLVGVATGVAWTYKRSGKGHVWCFVGDGAVDGGSLWEAFRYIAGWSLPMTIVVEDNNRSTCTSIKDRWGDRMALWPTTPSSHLIWYRYKPTYPHVGSGKYVQF